MKAKVQEGMKPSRDRLRLLVFYFLSSIINETGATNEAAENTVKLNELLEMFKSFKEDIGERMQRIEEKVGEFDTRLAASEAYVHEQLDARSEERGVKRTGTTMDDN